MPPLDWDRLRNVNGVPTRSDGAYVLYWMIAARRTRWNHALDRAVAWARGLDQPLVVLEPLRVDYPWASDRFHRFVLQGMADNARSFVGTGVLYHPYVEPTPGAGRGLLEALAADASVVVTDDYPTLFIPRMIEAAGRKLAGMERPVGLEAVDGNGILPMSAADRVFARAYDFRRYLQREIRPFLSQSPQPNALEEPLRSIGPLPEGVTRRWPRADVDLPRGPEHALGRLPIDHDVPPVAYSGGSLAGGRVLRRFIDTRLFRYPERNQPEMEVTSGLSPYLHFGHVSAHEVLHRVGAREGWSPAYVSDSTSGAREGWWNMSVAAEGFLDQLVTWRELGFNFCSKRDDSTAFESLPDWARSTLEEHDDDPRDHVYTLEQFERAETHDDLWNAAQNQLRIDGRIHNYLRMLWGKKILHWSMDARSALRIMLTLNDKYAVDGRDPNSYSGIMWVLGRYDRPWGPEREIFGKIRYMTCANTRRKVRVRGYIERWNRRQTTLSLEERASQGRPVEDG